MPLNLTTDKIVISVKPDYQPVIMTGYTPTIIVGSGGTIVTQTGQTFVVYSSNSTLPTVLIGSGNTVVNNISGNTWRIYTPTGGTSSITLVGSGQTTVTQSGNTWTISSPATDLSQYWTSGQTIDYVTGYTPTLDGYWNSGQTVSYINSKNYLTGFTVTAPMVTGITASLYAPIIHYHPQYLTGFTVTAPMVTGITSGLYLPINSLAGYWNSGQTTTYINNQGFITSLAGYWTSAQTQSWVESQNYLTGFTVTAPMVTGITDSLYLHVDALDNYWTSAQTVNYVSGITSGLTSSWNDIEDKPSWLTGTTLNGFQTGHTHSYNNLNDKPTLFTGNTFVASGACEISVVGDVVTIYAPSGGTGGVSEAVFSGYTGSTAPQTFMPIIATIKNVTGTSYTLLTSDAGKILQFTATGATTITVPSGTSFVQGYQVTLVNYGNGTSSAVKTIAAGGGATVKSANSALKLSTIFGAATLYKTPTANTWIAFGDLSA